jgi:hypothetical protein
MSEESARLFVRLSRRMSRRLSARLSRCLPLLSAERLRARVLERIPEGGLRIGLAPIKEQHNDAAAKVIVYHIFEIAKDIWKCGYVRATHRTQLRRLREAIPRAKSLHSDFAAYAREIAQSAEDAFRILTRTNPACVEDRQSAFAYFVCACELSAHEPDLRPSFGIVGMYIMGPPSRLSEYVNECLDMIPE